MTGLQTAPWSLMASNAPVLISVQTGGTQGQAGSNHGPADRRFADAMAGSRGTVLPSSPRADYTDHRRFTSADPHSAIRADDSAGQGGKQGEDFFGEDGFGLADFIDIINPLQHIPVVSTVYRHLTGDEISPGARLAGGTLFGGPVGFAGALADTIYEDATGTNIGDTVMAAVFGSPDDPSAGSALASADAVQDGVPQAVQWQAVVPPEATAQTNTSPLSAVQPSGVQTAALMSDAAPMMPIRAAGDSRISPLFAAQPVGSPLASVQPILPGQPAGTQTSPAQVAAQGVPNLSAGAATALMRMAQATEVGGQSVSPSPAISQAGSVITGPPQSADPIAFRNAPSADEAPVETNPMRPVQSPSQITAPQPAAIPSVSSSAAAPKPGGIQTAGFMDDLRPDDMPSAMMEALAKYEKMKNPG